MRLLTIGIDGLDPILLNRWQNELPNFQRILQQGKNIPYKSVYPIDSIPIWVSIFTGLSPAKHGIIHHIKYFGEKDEFDKINSNHLEGSTFWDIAGKHGKKVCVINPFMAYPSWQVNGIMVSGPVGINAPSTTYPEHIKHIYSLPHLGGVRTKFPVNSTDLEEFYSHLQQITLDEVDFGLQLLSDNAWDLAFINLVTLDGIEHSFWRYFDKSDPTYPGRNEFENSIYKFYKLHDEIIGRFMTAFPSAALLIISDHGHCMRSTKLVNVNEYLREKQYLLPKGTVQKGGLLESLKLKALDFIYKYELYEFAIKMTHLMPSASKKIQKSEYCIDFTKSKAFTSDFTGMNPFGGINICPQENAKEYEELRLKIKQDLLNLRDPDTNEKIVLWACNREELYEGEYISEYPDVLFELRKEYGVSWSIYSPLVVANHAHKVISGGHRREGTFLLYNINRGLHTRTTTSFDIAPTILDLLEIDYNEALDGSSILTTQSGKI